MADDGPIAAIDIGSNAMRLVITGADGGLLYKKREAVRLGEDVFHNGHIGQETWKKALKRFRRMRQVLDGHEVRHVRAVATSAMREAANSVKFVEAVWESAGIAIEVIDGEEEARLIHDTVLAEIEPGDEPRLFVDIGGGSVEYTLSHRRRVVGAETLKIGTLRMLELVRQHAWNPWRLDRELRLRLEAPLRRLSGLAHEPIGLCVGTGGNCNTLGKIARRVYASELPLTAGQLDGIIDDMAPMSSEGLQLAFGMAPDRADVFLPALLVLRQSLAISGCEKLMTLKIGLANGVLLQMRRSRAGV